MYFFLKLIIFINIYLNNISGKEYTEAYLNNSLEVNVNSTNPKRILYKIPVCKEKRFLRIKFESILKSNETVSIKTQSAESLFILENKYNQSIVVAKRIICSKSQLNQCGKTENSTINLSTNSSASISINITAYMIEDFTLNVGENRSKVIIDEYSPVYYILQFNDTNEDMEVKIVSEDDQCMFAFIEEAKCSLNILSPHLETYHKKTITKIGSIQIKNNGHYINNSLFIVFILADDKICNTNLNNQKLRFDEKFRQKKFNITFVDIDTNYVLKAIVLCLIFVAFGIFYVISVYLLNIGCECNKRDKENQIKSEQNEQSDTNQLDINNTVKNKQCLNKKNYYFMFWTFKYFLTSKYIFIISIFYTLPVVQLMIYYVNVMKEHGNFDLCFYNDGCSKPYRKLLAFNNVISNIGYMIMGLTFIIVVLMRHYFKERQKSLISPNYGIFYSLGLSLIMEGIMSLIYHICPRSDTIQFDATFMYIIGFLLVYYYAIQLISICKTIVNKDIIIITEEDHIITINSKHYPEPIDSEMFKITIKTKEGDITINSNCFNVIINSNNNNITINWIEKIGKNISKDNAMKINSKDYSIVFSTENTILTSTPIPNDNTRVTNINENPDCSNTAETTFNNSTDNSSTTGLIPNKSANVDVYSKTYSAKISSKHSEIINLKFNNIKINSTDNTISLQDDNKTDQSYESTSNCSKDNIRKLSLINYLTIDVEERINAISFKNNTNSLDLILIESEGNISTTNSTGRTSTINSTDNMTAITPEREIVENRRTINSRESEINVKEFFFFMSIVILFIILILICEGEYSNLVKWIFIGISQFVIVFIYCYKIFGSRWCCIVVIELCNLAVFAISYYLSYIEWLSFYLYFLFAIILNVLILKVEFYYKIIESKQRLIKCDWFTAFTLINIGIASILLIAAICTFYKAPTNWHKSPSKSREQNQECIILDFFDIHDLWHILSSLAMFLLFLVIFLFDCWIYEEENHQRKLESKTIKNENTSNTTNPKT